MALCALSRARSSRRDPYLRHRRRRIPQKEQPPARPDARPRFTGPPLMDKVRPESQSEHTPVTRCRAEVWAIVLATTPYLASARPAPSPSPPTSPAAAPAFAPIRDPEFAQKESATAVAATAAAGAAP